MNMRTIVTVVSAGIASGGIFLAASTAQARDVVVHSEEGYPAASRPVAAPGISAQALVGSGLDSHYGLTEGARVGYTTDSSVYLGADATRADNQAGGTDYLLGGELGYRYFPSPKFELRPFGIVGALIEKAAASEAATAPAPSGTPTRLAIVPGALAAYHFGQFFVSAEGRLQVVPGPAAASLLGGAGLTF